MSEKMIKNERKKVKEFIIAKNFLGLLKMLRKIMPEQNN
jgi:hypothetical protein